LKNVKPDLIRQNVEKTLKDTKLQKFRSLLVKELSGGMRRRLSLGISIVGNPSIVFLDEPSTGLDPENKRQIWEILSTIKLGKCIILTTHLMEEAEVLSDRMAIIVKGTLRCLGTQYKIKKVYGKGFKLVINLVNYTFLKPNEFQSVEEFVDERLNKVFDFVKNMFPSTAISEYHKNTLIFEVRIKHNIVDS
jgi:ABC-type multidrug transport system ATPase subunit